MERKMLMLKALPEKIEIEKNIMIENFNRLNVKEEEVGYYIYTI